MDFIFQPWQLLANIIAGCLLESSSIRITVSWNSVRFRGLLAELSPIRGMHCQQSLKLRLKKAASNRDPLWLARYYQSLHDSGEFKTRVDLARFLAVSRARVTQALKRLNALNLNLPIPDPA